MHVVNKYKIHALETANHGHFTNQTFYATKEDALARARECIRQGCDAIVVYEAFTVVMPTAPEVDYHEVD